MKKEKTFKRLCRYCCLTALLLGFSATAFADAMKNNPINTSGFWGDALGGTTFSAANNSEQTSFTSLNATQICWNKSTDKLQMASAYGYVTNTSYGTASSPKYRITNGSNSGFTAKLDATTNYLIFHAPKSQEDIATITVKGYKKNTEVYVCFNVYELSGRDKTKLKFRVNGYEKYQELPAGSESNVELIIPGTYSGLNKTTLTIEIARDNYNEGDNCVLAISDFYVYGEVDVISLDADNIEAELGTPLNLTAQKGVTATWNESQLVWLKHTHEEWTSWQEMPEAKGKKSLSENNLPIGITSYKVGVVNAPGDTIFSNIIDAKRYLLCSDETTNVLFHENFGTLSSQTDRTSNMYVSSDYTYVGGCAPLKAEGTYAVVANPRYGGCNDDPTDACTECEYNEGNQPRLWFRDMLDHTQNGLDAQGNYGGMLLVNADKQLVYSRQVNVPCAQTTMNFSAWFAAASDGTPISVQFIVRDEFGVEIQEATLVVDGIDFKDGWIKGETSFNPGYSTKLTVEIRSYNAASGGGNDFLVDDIRFTVCAPKIDLNATTTSASVQIDNQEKQVLGLCGDSITLAVDAAQAENLFDSPYYTWLCQSTTSWDYKVMSHWDGKTSVDTLVTDATQYYVLVTASKQIADYYLNNQANECEMIGISPVMSVNCAQVVATVQGRTCNKIVLRADVTVGLEFDWQISLDGQSWSDINGKSNKDTIHYTISEDTYFRINTAIAPSEPTVLVSPRSIELAATPAVLPEEGGDVLLEATPIGFEMVQIDFNSEVLWYQNSDYYKTNGLQLDTTLTQPSSFYVELKGCRSNEVNITLQKPISVEFVSRECNTLTLRAIAEEGVTYQWQKSTDGGQTWEDLDFTGSELVTTITENTMYRIYNDEMVSVSTYEFEVWSIELTVEPEEVYLGETITVTATTHGFRSNYPPVWKENGNVIEYEGYTYEVKPYAPVSYTVLLEGCESNPAAVNKVIWPTVFTPMLVDGFNDDFIIGMDPTVALKIYDRYGNLLVETTDGWDGLDKNGNYAMPGVYYYVATMPNGDVVKGNVELLNEKK